MEKGKTLANLFKMPKITIGDLLGVTVGSAIAAIAIRLFLDPCDIVPGGVSGLSMGVERLTEKLILKYFGDKDIPTVFVWIRNVLTIQWLNLIFNVPLFIFGAKLLGKKMAILTLLAIVELTIVLAFVPKYALVNDIMLNSIFGGITVGMGLGLVFRYGATTGGTDLAGAILNHKWPNFSIAKGMALVDLFIVAFIGIVTEKVEVSMYSLIAVYFCMKLADMMLDNFGYQKGFFIVSNKPQEIASALMTDLGRGVTLLKGEGMYSKQDRPVLLCVVSRSQFVRAKKVIQDVDGTAFIMVSDMSEVLGEGFKKEEKK
ncbi:MAG: YitT family protein [Treponema sp.]